MKAPALFDQAWTEAENACFDRIAEITGLQGGVSLFRGLHPDVANCANFQFARPKRGGCMVHDGSNLFPFSATLEMWYTTRPAIQALIMSVIRLLPDIDLDETNVQQFDFDATDGVSDITPRSCYIKSQQKEMDLYYARLSFVVVFYAGGR